jgi:phosphinothricin acetyltransferase
MNGPGWRLRDAAEADLPAIVAIYNATIPGRQVTADTQPVTVAQRLPWFRAHDPAKHPLWVAERNGVLGGWLSLSPYLSRPAYHITAEVSVYVHETRRREGLGRHFVSEAIARAPEFGLRNLVGLIWAHNEPSLNLFRGLGFAPWGRLPRVALLDAVERDLIIVGRRV